MSEATATPEGAPVSEEQGLEAVVAKLIAEEEAAEAEANAPEPEAETPEPAPDGDSEQEPEAEDGEQADEAPEAEAEPETEPQDPIYTVKVRGEEQQVPLSELLKGYSRTEDYKAKTAELARARETVETDVQKAYVEQLRRIEAEFVALDPVLAEAQSIDWNKLAQEDPAEYVARSHAVQSRERAVANVRAEITRYEQQTRAQEVQREQLALVAAKPELQAPEAFMRYVTDLSDYLSSEGIPPELLADMTHHKLYLIAEKARKWDEAQKAKASVPAKKAPPPVTAKPLRPAAQAPAPVARPPKNATPQEKLEWAISQI